MRYGWKRGFRYCWIENLCVIDFRPEYRGLPSRTPPADLEPAHEQ